MDPGGGYPDSVDSSPRSRGGESWDEPFPSAVPGGLGASAKLRLMCSYGGHIVPRPHDKSLCYLGGETRIVVIDRHATLAELSARLRALLGGRPFSLKYQLPSEDLDSLISVTTEEDFDNMVDEYDRVASAGPKPSRLRLFLFPAKPESAPASIGSLLEDSKSETWFVDALNGAIVMGATTGVLPRGLSADSGSSVNCLLGLEDDPNSSSLPPPQPPPPVAEPPRPESPPGKLRPPPPDAPSVPDSPMLDTTSSFGSASSAPILSNLPPIRVRPDDRSPPVTALDEHFAQMNVIAQKPEDFPAIHSQPPPTLAAAPFPAASTVAAPSSSAISSTENPSQGGRALSDDERSDRGGGGSAKLPPIPSAFDAQVQQRGYFQDGSPTGSGAEAKFEPDPSYRVQPPPPEPTTYMFSIPPEKFHQQQPHQQQYVQTNPQLVQHQPGPTPVLPYPSFYQMQTPIHSQQPHPATHGYNQQMPMYFVPVQPNPNYTLDPITGKPTVALPMPSSILQTPPPSSGPKPELVPGSNMYRTSASPQPQLIHLASQPHQQFMGYHPMQHHPQQSIAPGGYRYEFPNPVQPSSQIYYTQANSAPLPAHFQAVSSAAVTAISTEPLSVSDAKQTRPPREDHCK